MGKVLAFLPKGSKATAEIFEEGKLGSLDYQVFKRGVIHISNKGLLFKKDIEVFEGEVTGLELNKLKDGEEKRIPGSGDNDDLVFTCKNGDIVPTLEAKQYSVMSKIKGIIFRGKKQKETV